MAYVNAYPIVLAHGICRFDVLMNTVFVLDDRDDDRLHYFRKIRSHLAAHGYLVHHSQVAWAAGVQERAYQLREELRRITRDFTLYPKVHVIAHSMGGLDARHMIVDYEMPHRVASLATISTPHWGSSFADWGIRHFDRVVTVARRMGLDIAGFRDLTTDRCAEFNERAAAYEHQCGVVFRTYAGVQTRAKTFAPLRFSHRIIEAAEGENDGLVSLKSAKWRDEYFVKAIEADHRNEIGWWDMTDPEQQREAPAFEARIQRLYLEIASSLCGPARTPEHPDGA